MRKKVLLLTQWCEPEPTFKGVSFARELIKCGLDVEILTGFPNYPGGKLYPGYKIKFIQREIIDGVRVTRVPLYPSHDRSAVKRILNYMTFSISAFFFGLFAIRKPDVIYAYHPPLTVGFAACLIRTFRSVPVVYDIQDMWPDTLRATGMLNNDRLIMVIGWLCKLIYHTVDHITVLSPGFKKLLVGRGVPEDKIDVVYNWADELKLSNIENKLPAKLKGNRLKFLFAGNVGLAQDLGSVIDAFDKLQKYHADVTLVILGGGLVLDRLKSMVKELKINNVDFYPPVPMEEVGAYLQCADVLLVHLQDDELFKITIPSKTQAYMAIGKPILMAVDGDAADLIQEAGCGLRAKSSDPESIFQAMKSFVDMEPKERLEMGLKGKFYYEQHLSMSVGVKKMSQTFHHVIQDH